MTTYTQPTYPHGGGFSRNIVNYIEQVVGRALCDLDISMPEIENLSYGNDVCDSFGLKGYNFQVFIPNCLPQMHYSYEKNLLLNCDENVGYFGFKADYDNEEFDSFDDVDYDLDGITERIISFIKNFKQ